MKQQGFTKITSYMFLLLNRTKTGTFAIAKGEMGNVNFTLAN